MFERMMRFFVKIGDNLLGLFIKIMIVLVLLVIVVATVQGMINHWGFVLTLLIGMLLSPLFYREMAKKLNIELPEFFTWGVTDVIDMMIPNKSELDGFHTELKQKKDAAIKIAAEMESKANELEKVANTFIKERKMRATAKERKEGMTTPRMKKAMMMQLDDEENEVIRSLRDQQKEINWDSFL